MKIQIKKKAVVYSNALIFIITGFFLLTLLLVELRGMGFIGYFILWLFLLSLFLMIEFEKERKGNIKIAEKVARELLQEELEKIEKGKPNSLGRHYFSDEWKEVMKNHLYSKSEEEKISLSFQNLKIFSGFILIFTFIFLTIITFLIGGGE